MDDADYLKVIETQLGEVPQWLRYFAVTEGLREGCPDCSAKIGDIHLEGCDWARCQVCGFQRLSCDCEDGDGDVWIGICAPESHKICYEENLWCRDLIETEGDRVMEPGDFQKQMDGELKIRWHVPCERDDEGAHADLNRAAMVMHHRGEGNGCVSPKCFEEDDDDAP